MTTTTLNFDDGLLRIDINGNGQLVFNPTDLNLYERFIAFSRELPELENRYSAAVEDFADDEEPVALVGRELAAAKEIDAEIKGKLNAVFGGSNDFDRLLGGINLMAFGSNEERVITNLLHALTPYIEAGVKKHSDALAGQALRNRAERRAAMRK